MESKLSMWFSLGAGLGSLGALLYAYKTWRENLTLRKAFCLLKYRDKLKKESENISLDPLFFPDDRIMCRIFLLEGSCKDENCSYCHDEMAPLTQLVRLLQTAKETIDLARVSVFRIYKLLYPYVLACQI